MTVVSPSGASRSTAVIPSGASAERTRGIADVPKEGSGWRIPIAGIPSWRDPRLPFATILTVYLVLGCTFLGFNRSPAQILTTVAVACLLEVGLHWLLRKRELLVPLSALITGLSLAILLNYAHDHFLLVLPVFLSIASKYVFTVDGRHHYNPSLFGVATTLLVAGQLITSAPAYQWGGTVAMSAFVITLALAGFVFRIGRGWLIGSFLITYALQTALRAYLMRAHLPPEMLFLGTLTAPPFFLFTFFMITDPRTSPAARGQQIAVGISIALVDLVLHRFQSVFTFFYAAFAVATVRLLWIHGRRAWNAGVRPYIRATLFEPSFVRRVSAVGLVGGIGGAAYVGAIHPRVAIDNVGFRLVEVPASASGLRIPMDPAAYDLVDPRLRHIAKWLLSVGASVSIADLNGDDRPDIVLTAPLAIPDDRIGVWLNRGAMRFERVDMPAFAPFKGNPAEVGLASGTLLLDYDDDGDQDIFVSVSFGSLRLERNMLAETGVMRFGDVTERAGIGAYAISVGANAIDYDRDGNVDIVVGNVLDTHLREYHDSTRLSIFRLPAPAHPGDRRMFAFMHDGWHDAANGGRNLVLHNRGDGTFAPIDAATLGMPETHWSLSIGTGDLDSDGWTDLYIANDFGPDDFYLNRHGRFERVAGRMFGDVGRDTYKGMNSSIADFDRDGRLDVYVSNVHHALQAEGSLLWMNRSVDPGGRPHLVDEASARGALNENRFGWGAVAEDFDGDGWLDILQTNGMVDDRLDRRYEGCPDYWYVNHKLMQAPRAIHVYADMWGDIRGRCIYPNERRRLYLNRGASARPQFVDVAEQVGLTTLDNSRAAATADFDGDGRVDALTTNQHGMPSLLRNERTASATPDTWIAIQLVGAGAGCPRDASGSTVVVQLPGHAPITRETQHATGFSAQSHGVLRFGLGTWNGAVPVRVRWCGAEWREYSLEPNHQHKLTR
jgi:Na+-translocating ferredoxin:NAD+ oxidoreductase RnfD subunit